MALKDKVVSSLGRLAKKLGHGSFDPPEVQGDWVWADSRMGEKEADEREQDETTDRAKAILKKKFVGFDVQAQYQEKGWVSLGVKLPKKRRKDEAVGPIKSIIEELLELSEQRKRRVPCISPDDLDAMADDFAAKAVERSKQPRARIEIRSRFNEPTGTEVPQICDKKKWEAGSGFGRRAVFKVVPKATAGLKSMTGFRASVRVKDRKTLEWELFIDFVNERSRGKKGTAGSVAELKKDMKAELDKFVKLLVIPKKRRRKAVAEAIDWYVYRRGQD